jgi:hypothetical protein
MAPGQAEPTKQVSPDIEIHEPNYDFGQVQQGEIVKHDFQVFNRGTASLEITQVEPD